MGLSPQRKRTEMLVLLLVALVRLSCALPESSQDPLASEPITTLLGSEAEESDSEGLESSPSDDPVKRWLNQQNPTGGSLPAPPQQRPHPYPNNPNQCPSSCGDSRGQQPVCGTDGRDYASSCELRREACRTGRSIKPKHSGRCLKCAFGYQYHDVNTTIKVLNDHCMKIVCVLDSKMAPAGGIMHMARVHVRYDDTACGCCYYGKKRFETGNQIRAGCFRLVCFSGSWIPVPRVNHKCGRCSFYNHEHILPFNGQSYTWGTPCDSIMVQPGTRAVVPYKLDVQTKQCDHRNDALTCLHKVTYYEKNHTIEVFREHNNLQVYVDRVKFNVNVGPASLVYGVQEGAPLPIMAWRHNTECLRFVGTQSISFQVCPHRLDVFSRPDKVQEALSGLCGQYQGASRSHYPQYTDIPGGFHMADKPSERFGYSWKDPSRFCAIGNDRSRMCEDYNAREINGFRSTCKNAVEKAQIRNVKLPKEIQPHYIESCKVDLCRTRGNTSLLMDLNKVYTQGIDLLRGGKGMCKPRKEAYHRINLDNNYGLHGQVLVKKRLNSPLFGNIKMPVGVNNMGV